MITFSPSDLAVVKRVLYGNQKQSGAQNEAVVFIVAQAVVADQGRDAISTEGKFVDAVVSFLQNNKGSEENFPTCCLIVGTREARLLASGKECEISATSAGSDTPKFFFHVDFVENDAGEAVAKVEHHTTVPETKEFIPGSRVIPKTAREVVDDIRDKIAPLVPEYVKQELGDDLYAQALWGAPLYYAGKHDMGGPDINKVAENVVRIIEAGGNIAANVQKYFEMYRKLKKG